jgi:putative Holliday junction resolvase
VDYGRRRIGIAVADPLGISVRGLPDVVENRGDLADAAARTAAALLAVCADAVVVGLPLHADGRESVTSREVRRFADLLRERFGRPVELFDETLTSWEAEEDLKAAGRRLADARRSGAVDRQAARRLLLSYLRERERLEQAGAGPDGPRTEPPGPPGGET